MSRATRFLTNPKTIVAEVAVITATLVVSTVVPQAGDFDSPGRLPSDGVALAAAVRLWGLDHPFGSGWFLGLVGLAAASLSLVLVDQTKKAWRLWRRVPSPEALVGAPFKREGVFRLGSAVLEPRRNVRVRGALGVWGSPLFHFGLLLVIGAGLVRMLFGAEAVVDLMVGETLPSRADAYGAQWPGRMAGPFVFPVPVQLNELEVDRYPSGAMRSVRAVVRLGGDFGELSPLAINLPLRQGAHTLYLHAIGGAAALVEVSQGHGRPARLAILLREGATGSEGRIALSDGTQLRAAANEAGVGHVPKLVDVRAMRGSVLAGVALLSPGGSLDLPDGTRVTLADVVPWVQLAGKRDTSTPIVYAGFILACMGALLMVAVIRVDSAVITEGADGGVKLTVLMRPYRFAPLFAPAFESLWAETSAGLGGAEEGQNVG